MTHSDIAETESPARAQGLRVHDKELRYRSFVDNNIEGAWRLDLEEPIPLDLPAKEQVELLYHCSYFAEANQALANQYGFDTPAEIIGFRLEEFLPRDLPTSIPLLTQAAEAQYCVNGLETIEQDRHGNRKIFLNNLVGQIEDGKLLRVWGTARDITRQKQLEEEARLRSAVFEQIPDGCVIVESASEKVVYSNATFTRITGYAAAEIPDKKLSFLQGAGTDPNTVSQIREAIAQEQEFRCEILNYRKDGTPFWNRMRISPIRDTDGVVTHYVGILTDITDKKRTEKWHLEQRNALSHLARVATMGELTAALAHELNQPLAAMLSNAQAAQRFLDQKTPDIDEVREILKDIVADDKRARTIMDRVRHMVKREAKQTDRLDMNRVIEEVHALLSNDLALKQVQISMRLAPKLPALHGDPVQLQQVLVNLVMNASHAVQDLDLGRRRITLSTRNIDDQEVAITVRDSGRGIDERILDQIFQPFFSTKEQGMGMGLAINRTIVEAHGGRIWAENAPDGGAVFVVTLPNSP